MSYNILLHKVCSGLYTDNIVKEEIMKGFKSSAVRLARLFKKGRDMWKKRALEKQKKLRAMQTKVRDLSKSRDQWKERAIQAEQILKQSEPKSELQKGELIKNANPCIMDDGTVLLTPGGHHYSVCTIQLAVQQITESLTSFRGAQRNFEIFSQFFNIQTPGFAIIRVWMLRLGLYNLQQNAEFRLDWIIVFDNTVELGANKCLLTLGIPREQFEKKMQNEKAGLALCHQDMTVLDIDIMSRCNGEVINQKLEDLTKRIGAPVQIVSDNSSDLKKGIELYRQNHPETVQTYDVTHKMATLVKKNLEGDKKYAEFSKKGSQAANEIRQTPLSFLKPRADRTKSRYLNLDRHVKWCENIFEYERKNNYSKVDNRFILDEQALNRLKTDVDKTTLKKLSLLKNKEFPDRAKFSAEVCKLTGKPAFSKYEEKICCAGNRGKQRYDEKIGWISGYKREIERWSEMLELVNTVNKQIKCSGLNRESPQQFENNTGKTVNPELLPFRKEIIDYLKEQSENLPEGQTVLGSSDVIESVFGKYKLFSSSGPLKETGKMIPGAVTF